MPSFSTLPHSALLCLLLPASGAIRPIQLTSTLQIAPHCAAVAPGSPALGALLPYRVPTLVPSARPLASQLCIQLQLHPPAHVCALRAARRRPTRLPVFAPSTPPAAGLPVRRRLRPQPARSRPLCRPPLHLCVARRSLTRRSLPRPRLRPLRHPPQAYPSAGCLRPQPARSRPLRRPPLAHLPVFAPFALPTARCPLPAPLLQYLFLQTYPPTVLHHPGTSPYFSVPGCFPHLLTLPSQYILSLC
ncbi:hypothetical protein B0H14DRAFT_3462308 [Mycena olivaceomarginata]|nr:hypothetical protein B0H14DRAFT_3462308 [Mycena olivaceomarginata]